MISRVCQIFPLSIHSAASNRAEGKTDRLRPGDREITVPSLCSDAPHVIVVEILWNLYDPGKGNKWRGSQQGFDEGKKRLFEDECNIWKLSAVV